MPGGGGRGDLILHYYYCTVGVGRYMFIDTRRRPVRDIVFIHKYIYIYIYMQMNVLKSEKQTRRNERDEQ